jgi:hypothetical protein
MKLYKFRHWTFREAVISISVTSELKAFYVLGELVNHPLAWKKEK